VYKRNSDHLTDNSLIAGSYRPNFKPLDIDWQIN